MNNEKARLTLVENLAKMPQAIERQFESLFANPHFGDVVSEVFPEVLNPHSENGRSQLAKYSELAQFLEDTKGTDEAPFIAIRVETEQVEYDAPDPRMGLKALSVRYFKGLRGEDFEVVRDEEGKAIGIGVNHSGYVYAKGWAEDNFKGTAHFAVIDTPFEGWSWGREPKELESSASLIFGKTDDEAYNQALQMDVSNRLLMQPISGVVLDMQMDTHRIKAGAKPRIYSPIEDIS